MTAWDWVAASVRRWYVVVAGVLLAVGILHGIATAPGVYSVQTQILFLAPVTPQSPNTISSPTSGVISTAGLVERIVNRGVEKSSTSGAVSLTGQGVDDGHSVELPNAGGQWASNFNRPVLQIQVTGSTKDEVQENLDALIEDIRSTTSALQLRRGVSRGNLISTQVSPSDPGIAYNQGHRRMALVVTGLLALALTSLAALAFDRIVRRHASERAHGQPVQRTVNIGEIV